MNHVNLSDVCEIIAGQSPPSSTYNNESKGLPFFQGKADFGEMHPSIRMWCSEPKKVSLPDDILISVRAPVGPTNINNIESCIGRGLSAIRCSKKIKLRFLLHFLRSNEKKIADKGTGSTFKAITQKDLKVIQVPLPPLPVQQKIAAILDTADGLKQKDKALIAKYDELSQSLFLDMFGDLKDNIKNFNIVTVGDVTDLVKDGPHVSPKYSDSGIPILSTRNIRPFELVLNEIKYVSESTYEKLTKRFCPQKNDILLTKGGTTGYAKVVDFDWKFCIWVHLAALRPTLNLINPKYLESALNSHYCYIQSQKYTRGIANKDLGLTRMINIQLLSPPINLQNQFAERIQAIEQQKHQAQASLQKSEDLFNCLLQKAFKGELV